MADYRDRCPRFYYQIPVVHQSFIGRSLIVLPCGHGLAADAGDPPKACGKDAIITIPEANRITREGVMMSRQDSRNYKSQGFAILSLGVRQ